MVLDRHCGCWRTTAIDRTLFFHKQHHDRGLMFLAEDFSFLFRLENASLIFISPKDYPHWRNHVSNI